MVTRTLYDVILVTSFVVLLLGCSDGGDNNGGDNNSPGGEVTQSTPDNFLQFFNQYDEPGLEAVTYAQAYYAAIDPGNKRDTLNKFISHHANDGSDWLHVIFRDTMDLGYGRDMYMREHRNKNGCPEPEIAFYVRNFVVAPVPGFDYGPLNLDAAINNDTKYHFGTNAIEVSRADDDVNCTGPRFLKFFTYAPTGERLLFADFDGRGFKAMPQICVSCHGGTLRPLDSNRNFTTTYANDTEIGDTKSRLMPFSVDTFEFSNIPGFTRAAMEQNLKIINDTIRDTYVPTENPQGLTAGEWQGTFARKILEGHYTDPASGQPSQTYISDFVPDGWKSSMGVGRPANTDRLYREVVHHHCIVCHAGRGTNLSQDGKLPNREDRLPNRQGMDIDFETWEKFASYAEDIARLVFAEGRMPLALLNFETFWEDPGKPALLASFIAPLVSDFNAKYVNADGSIKRPGRPIAHAGLDRLVPPNTPITLNGGSSLFASQFRWEVVTQPNNSSPALDQATSLTPVFTTHTEGTYELSLTVSNDGGMSHMDMVTLVVDARATDPSLTRFAEVKQILQGDCVACHTTGQKEELAGIPVWYTDMQPASSSLSLYQQVRARVNLADVPHSLLLTKPSGLHHYGSQRPGFDISKPLGDPARGKYDLFVNWIYAGAPE
jgi:mono/diheme cytochrome c family protein